MKDPKEFLPLPNLSYHVLLALAREDLHGWGVIRRIEDIAGDDAPPSSGSLYLAIARLEERELLEESPERPEAGDDRRRRYYRLTELGRAVLEAETVRLGRLVDLARDWTEIPAPTEEPGKA